MLPNSINAKLDPEIISPLVASERDFVTSSKRTGDCSSSQRGRLRSVVASEEAMIVNIQDRSLPLPTTPPEIISPLVASERDFVTSSKRTGDCSSSQRGRLRSVVASEEAMIVNSQDRSLPLPTRNNALSSGLNSLITPDTLNMGALIACLCLISLQSFYVYGAMMFYLIVCVHKGKLKF